MVQKLNFDEEGAETLPSDTHLRVVNLKKSYRRRDGSHVRAIDDISIDVRDGEILVLLGPSGCGKTTLLRAIAGLETPDSGTIEIGNKIVYSSDGIDLRPQARPLSMVFQSYALWPHMTALEIVAYPLRSRGSSGTESKERALQMLTMVDIPELEGQFPGQMSGGQQQRVALARALAADDGLVLFDEPLSNVDAKVREQLRSELLDIQRRVGFSAVYVTHDQHEAMQLSDRIAVLQSGRVAQLGTARAIYEDPVSRYVASFVGTVNEFSGRLRVDAESGGASHVLETDHLGPIRFSSGCGGADGSDVATVIFRPEKCTITRDRSESENAWQGRVRESHYLGAITEHVIQVASARLVVWDSRPRELAAGDLVWVSVDPSAVRCLADE